MNSPTDSNAPIILDIDLCDAPEDLCERYCVSDMSVAEFDAALLDIDTRMRDMDRGYAKLRFTFAWVDADGDESETRMRIDPGDSSHTTSLKQSFESTAHFFRSPRGDEYASATFTPCGTVTGAQAAELYDARALAVTQCSQVQH